MNIVFWILVVLVTINLWILLSPSFKLIGKSVLGILNRVKKGIVNKESEDK